MTPERDALAEMWAELRGAEAIGFIAEVPPEIATLMMDERETLQRRYEAAWADRNKIAGEYQDLILRLTEAERRLAEKDEALRRVATLPGTWQAEIAREALRAEPAKEEA